MAKYLRFGWPINRGKGPVEQTWGNHSSAIRYSVQVTWYIQKEVRMGTLLGPFLTSPFLMDVTAVSPLLTRPKKNSSKRRIIMDLSWPPQGNSVNELIPKDTYMGAPCNLRYPVVEDLCRRAYQLKKAGVKSIFGWKKDMERAFKQIPLCPSLWPLIAMCWDGLLYFDKMAVMGCRLAPYICQRMTNLIRHIMANIQYIVYNYIDDFMSLDELPRAWQAYNTLGNLLRDLGVNDAEDKSVEPCQIIEFLGILYNFINMTILIPKTKYVTFVQTC